MPCCKQNSCRVKPLSRHWRTRVNMYSLRSLISIIFGRKAKDDHLNRKYAVGRADTFKEIKNTLPKSQIGKAMAYAYARWDALSAYLYDGNLQIDTNQCENALRPCCLGRKNYLFAGSHQAAQRAAMIYSFFAICKKHDVNPFQWLKYTLQNIMTINHKNLKNLFPQNYKNITP